MQGSIFTVLIALGLMQPTRAANIEDRREDRSFGRSFLDFSVQLNENEKPDRMIAAKEKFKRVFELQKNINSPLARSLGEEHIPWITLSEDPPLWKK